MTINKFQSINLGPLPVSKVNAYLGLNLIDGDVRFKSIAQAHAFERHPNDFELCLVHIQRIISQPDFIGRGPNQTEGFEMIGKVSDNDQHILVAVTLRLDNDGFYNVASTYRIDTYSVRRRIRKGFLSEL